MSRSFKFNEIPKKEAPTKQQVAIVHVLSGNDASESLGNGLEKMLVLEEPVQQKHSLVTVLGLQHLQTRNTQRNEEKAEFKNKQIEEEKLNTLSMIGRRSWSREELLVAASAT